MAEMDPNFTPDPTAGLIPVAQHYRRPKGSKLAPFGNALPDASGALSQPRMDLLDPNTGLPPASRPAPSLGGLAVADATTRAGSQPAPPPSDWRDVALDFGVGGGSALAGGLGAVAGGPPMAIGLAGLTGSDLSMLADMARAKMGTPRAPGSFGQAAGNAAINGGVGAVSQGAGELLNFLRPGAAATMARGAFPRNMPVAYEKAFGNVMPEPWVQMLEHPDFPSVGKSAVAGSKALESSAAAKALEASNLNQYHPEDFLGKLDSEISRMERVSSTPAADVLELKNLRRQWLAGNVPEMPPPPTLYDQFGNVANTPEPPAPRTISGVDAPETKRFANRAAKAALQSSDTGSALRASAPNAQLYNKALAAQIRERIGADVPGLMSQDATTRYWMAAEAALQAAEKAAPRPLGAAPYALFGGLGTAGGAMVGHGPQAGIGTMMALAAAEQLRNPAFLSAGAKALSTPAAAAIIRSLPQLGNIPSSWLLRGMTRQNVKHNPFAIDSTAAQPAFDPNFTPDSTASDK